MTKNQSVVLNDSGTAPDGKKARTRRRRNRKKKNLSNQKNLSGKSEGNLECVTEDNESGRIHSSNKAKKKLKKNHLSSPNVFDSEILKEEESVIHDDNSLSASDDESDISSDESMASVSSFNIDSYPSDDDDDEAEDEDAKESEKKLGIPFKAVPSEKLEEEESRTIFVGNLPKTVERNELKKWFSRFGRVECVRLRSAPIADIEIPRKVAVIKKSFHESRTNIHAYIRFKNLKGATNALQANGFRFEDHTLRVDQAKHEGGYDANKAVFVGNLPFSIEEDSLINMFLKCGEIESVRIIRDKETGVGKGFAYINFKCSSCVPLALKLNGEVLEKREIRVKPAKYNRKKNVGRLKLPQKFGVKNRGIKGGGFGKKSKDNFVKNSGLPKNDIVGKVKKANNQQSQKFSGFKKTRFQGELSKKKEAKPFKKKSRVVRRRELYSKILNKNRAAS